VDFTSDITFNPTIDFGNTRFSYSDILGREKGILQSESEIRQTFAKLPAGIYVLNMIENGTITAQQKIIITK
jgi:hypothetical protein